MDPSDSLAPPAHGDIGVRVEILPDVFVEMETVRRIHALLLLLVTLIALWFRGQSSLRLALVRRPVLPALAEVSAPPAASPAARPASELHFLEGFARARKRALEVLQYAITTAPPALRTRTVELAGDPAAPLDPGRFRLKLSCTPTDETISHAFLENLRVLFPQAAVVSDEADVVTRIDSGASQVARVTPASSEPLGEAPAPVAQVAPAPAGAPVRIVPPSGGVIEIGGAIEVGGPPAPASPAAPAQPGLVRTADGGALITAVISDDASDPLPAPSPAKAFPRATAVPAPNSGRLVPLFAAPKAKPDPEEPEDGELE